MKPKWHWSNSPNREEVLLKIGNGRRGKGSTLKGKKGHKNKYKGKHLPWIGHAIPHTKEAKEKMRLNAYRMVGKYNRKWKGNNVGIDGLHSWVKRNLGFPMICEHCGVLVVKKTGINWANKSYEYKRDTSDWLRLCVKCHRAYDKK